ncbi:MAG: helix-turn-helix transcriptional regulator [Lysobacterales bacterium]
MPKLKDPESTALAKQELIDAVHRGDLTLGQSVRRMRNITGMSQKAYAQKIVGISPRVLAEIERDVANPTVETLNKVGRPFGYRIGFVHR